MTDQNKPKTKLPFPQVVFTAALMVVALDLWLGFTHPMTKAVTPNFDRSETFSAKLAYDRLPAAPDVVLLGSSLVVAPVMQAEAIQLGKPFPRFERRESSVISNLIGKQTGLQPSVFCFAVAGEAVSDAYMITKHVLAGPKKPKAIVYGIAPRDFQDNTCPGVHSTEAFQILADLNDVKQVASRDKLNFEQTANLALSRISSLWKYRNDIRLYANLRTKKTMERFMPWVVFEKYDSNGVLAPRKKGQFPEEAIGSIQAFPNVPMENVGNIKTIQQYIRRYRPENAQAVCEQFDSLAGIMQVCKDNDIQLILVSMPLSKTNIELLPDGFYSRYNSRLQQLCAHAKVPLFDLSNSYQADDVYTDTVHLKPEVSQQFLAKLVNAISKKDFVASLGTSRLSASNPPKQSL